MWNDRYAWSGRWSCVCFDPATLMAGAAVGSSLIGGATSLIGGSDAEAAGEQSAADIEAGAALSASGTIAGGDAALMAGQLQQQAAYYAAEGLEQNAPLAVAAGQRQALDTTLNTNLAISTARANAAGNGVNVAVGSPATIQGQLAQRGSYNAAMDMFNGKATATGLLNEAAGERYSGDAALIGGQLQQRAAQIAAQATIAGGKASADSALASGNAALTSSIGSAFSSFGNAAKTYGGFAYPANFRT